MCYNCFTVGAYLLYRIIYIFSLHLDISILLVILQRFPVIYVFEAGLTLKKSHQLFFSLQHTRSCNIWEGAGAGWYMCSFEANLGICMLCSPGPTEKNHDIPVYQFIKQK